MTNILTAAEAANFVRSTTTDPIMLQLLPMIDEFLLDATGHNWAGDEEIDPLAKFVAGTLLVNWYDNPGMVGNGAASDQLATLEAKALSYRKYEFSGLNGAGWITLSGAHKGDQVMSLVGIYNLSGDQSDLFSATISNDGMIEQLSAADLSDALFVVVLKRPAEGVDA